MQAVPTGGVGPHAGSCLPAEQRLGWETAAQRGAWAPSTRGGLQGIKPLGSDLERLGVSRERSLEPPPLPFSLSVSVPLPSLGPWRAPSPEHQRLRQPEVTWCPVLTTRGPCHWSKLYGQPQGHPKPCGLLPQATFIKKETHVFSMSRVCPPEGKDSWPERLRGPRRGGSMGGWTGGIWAVERAGGSGHWGAAAGGRREQGFRWRGRWVPVPAQGPSFPESQGGEPRGS